jgi:hypothetical protein
MILYTDVIKGNAVISIGGKTVVGKDVTVYYSEPTPSFKSLFKVEEVRLFSKAAMTKLRSDSLNEGLGQ